MDKEPAQVILSWLGNLQFGRRLMIVQRGVAVIPKSSTESRIKSNFELFELDKEDFDAIEGITAKKGQKRYCNLDGMFGSHLFEGEVL
jgi:diketogulonate reductase-like aldo/keto reductase